MTGNIDKAVQAAKVMPSQEVLMRLLKYDATTGKLYWLPRDASMMRENPKGKDWAASNWNSKQANKEAFTSTDPRGYKHGKINGVNYQSHRVIWKIVHGTDPEIIDHVNGDASDNRISNLRSGSMADNSRNYEKKGEYSSLFRGVHWHKKDKRWITQISLGHNGKKRVGAFKSERAAALAYDAFALEHHGEFATLNFPAAAQADFERRVRECLVAKPVDVAAVRRQALEEAKAIAFDTSENGQYMGNGDCGENSIYQQGAREVYGAICDHIESAPSAEPAQGDQWQDISTAEERAFDVILQIPDPTRAKGYKEVIGHWAQDLSGEEQPPFRGWFTDAGFGFREVYPAPTHWRRLPPATPNPEEGK